MILRHSRLWIPAGIVAAAAVVGTWIVVDYSVDPMRPHLVMLDAAETVEMIGERYAAQTYAAEPTPLVFWTSLDFATSGVSAAWGGYSNVTITCAGMDGAYKGAFYFSRRVRSLAGFASDRGFMDVYTNAIATYLMDLGPHAGSQSSPGNLRGGWVLHRPGLFAKTYTLPRGFHLSSGRFLSARYGENGADGWPVELRAVDFDPATVSVAMSGTVPGRLTIWDPPVISILTNHMVVFPVRDEKWLTGSWADRASWSASWTNASTAAPLLCMRPVSPLANGAVYSMIDSIGSSYADHFLATSGLSNFDGWTSSVLPMVTSRTNWNVWSWNTNAVLDPAALAAMGRQILDCRTLVRSGYWTNVIDEVWHSGEQTGDTFEAALEALKASPGVWTPYYATTNAYIGTLSSLSPTYAVGVLASLGDWVPGFSRVWFYRESVQAGLVGMAGRGANANGYHEVSAHYWSTRAQAPAGETIIEDGVTNELVLVETLSAPGPDVYFGRWPSYAADPPGDYLSGLSSRWDVRRAIIDAVVITASPDFDVEPGI